MVTFGMLLLSGFILCAGADCPIPNCCNSTAIEQANAGLSCFGLNVLCDTSGSPKVENCVPHFWEIKYVYLEMKNIETPITTDEQTTSVSRADEGLIAIAVLFVVVVIVVVGVAFHRHRSSATLDARSNSEELTVNLMEDNNVDDNVEDNVDDNVDVNDSAVLQC